MTTTSRQTHTPGPWEFDQSGEYMTYDVIRNKGMIIARPQCLYPMARDEYHANARLIAKAPELLDLVVGWIANDDPPTLSKAREIARVLLAEIRGESES